MEISGLLWPFISIYKEFKFSFHRSVAIQIFNLGARSTCAQNWQINFQTVLGKRLHLDPDPHCTNYLALTRSVVVTFANTILILPSTLCVRNACQMYELSICKKKKWN